MAVNSKVNGEGWIRFRREWGARLEQIADVLNDKYRVFLVAAIVVLYLLATVPLARAKLFWTDEFFTLFLSRLPIQELWTALLSGGDQHPPPFYLVHHFFLAVFGEHSWVLRLPAIFGFLLMMICIYRFVARRTSPVYGLLAMAMPLVTIAHEYSYEARGYSLMVGFLALAALSWQQAGETPRGWFALLGLAAGLVGAVASHYYAVLLLPAFALAEVVRSYGRKSINPMIWLAMCAPILPLVAFYPFLHSSSRFSGTFWAKPSLDEVHLFYKNILGSGLTCLLCGFAMAGGYQMVFDEPEESGKVKGDLFPAEEIVLAATLAAAPFVAYLFGKLITGAFTWRYALGGIIGLAILFGFFSFRFFRGSRTAASLFTAVIVLYFAVTSQVKLRSLEQERRELEHLIAWLGTQTCGSEPLIVGDSEIFYKLSYYTPAGTKPGYVYLLDANRSRKYLHHDTVERSLSALNPWFRLDVKDYDSFLRAHPAAMVWSGVNPKWNWLLSALLEDGENLRLVGRIRLGMLFSLDATTKKSEP